MIIGEICHIEGVREKSGRYNPTMTQEQRKSFDNLILLCPTHHTTIDKNPIEYTTGYLTKMKTDHENKNKINPYNIPSDILKVINVSVNNDEYSLERIYNLLKIYKKLQGIETKKLWYDYFKYALKGLKLSSPLSEDEEDVLKLVFDDILSLESEDIMLDFLDVVPNDIRKGIEKIKSYLETISQQNFTNVNLPRFYKHLNKSDTDTLEYLINNAHNFDKEKFDLFLSNANIDLRRLAEMKTIFFDFERTLWIRLSEGEREKQEHPSLYENIKNLVNKFIGINL